MKPKGTADMKILQACQNKLSLMNNLYAIFSVNFTLKSKHGNIFKKCLLYLILC